MNQIPTVGLKTFYLIAFAKEQDLCRKIVKMPGYSDSLLILPYISMMSIQRNTYFWFYTALPAYRTKVLFFLLRSGANSGISRQRIEELTLVGSGLGVRAGSYVGARRAVPSRFAPRPLHYYSAEILFFCEDFNMV